MADEAKSKGRFHEMLVRNNRQIKEDRAEAIVEMAELKYRRRIEDMEVELKEMKRKRENMLDLSPETALSLRPAKEFDADDYVNVEVQLARDIRDGEIMFQVVKDRFEFLFGKALT